MCLMQLEREGIKPSGWYSDEFNELFYKCAFMTYRCYAYQVFVEIIIMYLSILSKKKARNSAWRLVQVNDKDLEGFG